MIRIVDGLNLGGLIERVDAVTPDALRDAAEHVLQASQRVCPVLVDVERANRHEEPGTLRDSGYADVIDDTTAVVGYRDFIAARQHEDTTYHHDIGIPKFLEIPMSEEGDNVVRIIGDRVDDAL